MAKQSAHTEWISLVEVTEPFLSIPSLDSVLPDGPERIEPKLARKVRDYYAQWNEAGDGIDNTIIWIRNIIESVLQFDSSVFSQLKLPENGNGVSVTSLIPIGVVKSSRDDLPRLIVVCNGSGEDPDDPPSDGKTGVSYHDQAIRLARINECRLVLLTNGNVWRFIDAAPGRSPGFLTWRVEHWIQERITLAAFRSLLEKRRFFGVPDHETPEGILDDSLEHQEDITTQLGKQVREAVILLVRALDHADRQRNRELLEGILPERLYEACLTVMMRMVFLFAAEERDLLPLENEVYFENYALTPLRAFLENEQQIHGAGVLERRFSAWARIISLFRAVFAGIHHNRFQLSALGGSLFDPDRFPFLEGRDEDTDWQDDWAKMLPVDDRTVLHMLRALQLLRIGSGRSFVDARTLSYRALDVEQIGYVYEGLLDHTATRVDTVVLGFEGKSDILIGLDELNNAKSKGIESVVQLIDEQVGGGKKKIAQAIESDIEPGLLSELEIVCEGDEELARNSVPYSKLLDRDLWGRPAVYLPGSFAVVEGTERRASGTHYTPVTLTEAMVRETLEPVVYEGPAEGWGRSEWKLKRSEELLELKVCDPAMGSLYVRIDVVSQGAKGWGGTPPAQFSGRDGDFNNE